jgi:hypothetical protein
MKCSSVIVSPLKLRKFLNFFGKLGNVFTRSFFYTVTERRGNETA